jgi:Flp pilus assembly protein TadG
MKPVLYLFAPFARMLRTAVIACEGSAAVEAAIVLPIFFSFVFGISEVGRALWVQSALQYAVEDAARCAAVNTSSCGNTSAVQSYAAGRVFGITIPSSSFSVTKPSCGNQVSISYAFSSVVPNLVPFSVTLTAQSCHP